MKWLYLLLGAVFAIPLGFGSWEAAKAVDTAPGHFSALWMAILSVLAGGVAILFVAAAASLFREEASKRSAP